MDEKHTIEQVLSQFTAEEESKNHANVKASPANKVPTKSSEETPESAQETPRMTVAEEREARRIEIQKNLRERGLGWVPVPLEDLPSGGIFYPVGTKVNVRAASGGDIRHWSMMNETEITEIDNALNYIIERCVSITYGERPGRPGDRAYSGSRVENSRRKGSCKDIPPKDSSGQQQRKSFRDNSEP